MFGPPKDVDGECNARLILGDDYGDNDCTFRCQLVSGRETLRKMARELLVVTEGGNGGSARR